MCAAQVCPKWPWKKGRSELSKVLSVLFVCTGSLVSAWIFSLIGEMLVEKVNVKFLIVVGVAKGGYEHIALSTNILTSLTPTVPRLSSAPHGAMNKRRTGRRSVYIYIAWFRDPSHLLILLE